jgi:dTDP-4-amino-4,6-dideoxygalactose transaminase
MLLVSDPILGTRETAALSQAIGSGWITMGERVRAFEQAFAAAQEAEDAVAVSSCTAALHLVMRALGVGPGDEVLVPALTFVASANCVLYERATPVFVDIESADVPLMSLADAERRLTRRTKAIVLVHFAGYLADREAWRAFARRNRLLLVEDAAHAPGVPEVGTYGEAAAFSFYGNKNMTTAEGGAVVAGDPLLRERIRQMRSHGMTIGTRERLTSSAQHYDVTMLGFNYRMDDLRAAVGLAQIRNLKRWNGVRERLTQLYRTMLAQRLPSVRVPFSAPRPSAYHILPALLPPGTDRQAVVDRLREREIQTTLHYPPLHLLSCFSARRVEPGLPATEDFAARELTLPLHPKMGSRDVALVVDALAWALAPARRTLVAV